MENHSLEELKSLIEEEIYLIPEDREAILASLDSAPDTRTESPKPPVQSSDAAAAAPSPARQAPPAQVEDLVPEPIPVKGNFSKGVLILHEEASLREDLMEMLVKMINACGHSMAEIGLLPAKDLEGRSMEEFKALNAHTILKFGRVNHPINAVQARPYEVHAERETEYLFADSLTAISENVALKKKLWTSLQVLFNLT